MKARRPKQKKFVCCFWHVCCCHHYVTAEIKQEVTDVNCFCVCRGGFCFVRVTTREKKVLHLKMFGTD